jgi:carbonic anhydrase/acetyltransferase-like protein (isoleucine patch superfamily)
MLLEHNGERPKVHPTAYIAPNATLCGDVTVSKDSRVIFGAVLTAEGGPVRIGDTCVVMENALIRGTKRHPTNIGDNCVVGPRTHLVGCQVGDNAFLATGSTIFNGAYVGEGAEVRVNGTVHLRTALPAEAVVPIGWVAVGEPAEVLAPGEHERIWELQEPLDFPGTVFGVERGPAGTMMPELTRRYAAALGAHLEDAELPTK